MYKSKVAAIHKLRVNIKSLAAEARIIRHEEEVCENCYRYGLEIHRVTRLRRESRYAQLALGFLRGRKYTEVERSYKNAGAPDTKKLYEKLSRFYNGVPETEVSLLDQVKNWLAEHEGDAIGFQSE